MTYDIQTANTKVRELNQLLIQAADMAEDLAQNYPWLSRLGMNSLPSRLAQYRDNKHFHGDTQHSYLKVTLSEDLTYDRFLNEFVGTYLKSQEHSLGFSFNQESFEKNFFAWNDSFGIPWEKFETDLRAKLKSARETRMKRSELRDKLGIDRMESDPEYARNSLKNRLDAFKQYNQVVKYSEEVYLGYLKASGVTRYYDPSWKAGDLPTEPDRFIRWRGMLIHALEADTYSSGRVRLFRVLAPVTIEDFRDSDEITSRIENMTSAQLFQIRTWVKGNYSNMYFKIVHEVDSGSRWNMKKLAKLIAHLSENYDELAGSHERDLIGLLNAYLQDHPELEFKRQDLLTAMFESKFNMAYHVSPSDVQHYRKLWYSKPVFETRSEFEDELHRYGMKPEKAYQLSTAYTGLMGLVPAQ